MNTRTYHIPIFVPHSGCPHDCVFCNQRRITGVDKSWGIDEAEKIIKDHLNSIKSYDKKDKYVEIAFFGGSFTGIEKERQLAYLEMAKTYIDKGLVQGIRCSTRPDYISEEILDTVKAYGMTAIELGVQSCDEEVLKSSRRGHSFQDVEKASCLIKKYNISLGLQMMTGLPGDSFEKSLETAKKIADFNPDCVRIYPSLVMEGTALFDMYKKGSYLPWGLDETAELVSRIIEIFERKDINIIRIGLQTTDNVNKNTVIGPYHEAMAELSYGRVYRRAVEKSIKGTGVCEVKVNPSCVSLMAGHKKENKQYFSQKGIELKIVTDVSLDKKTIAVDGKKIYLYN